MASGVSEEQPTNAVCAWCGASLSPVEGLPEGEVTHGICAECFEREMALEEDGDGNVTKAFGVVEPRGRHAAGGNVDGGGLQQLVALVGR